MNNTSEVTNSIGAFKCMPYDTDPFSMNPSSVQIAAPRNQF